MEQMYLVEIFVDKVTIYASDEDDKSGANKNLIIKVKFGPKVQFIIKEGQLSKNDNKDDIVECDEYGKRKWTRTIRVGKSYLFPSYSDTVLMILNKFPLEIEVWNDDENEVEIFVGIGTMYWETEFYRMLKETADASKVNPPLTIKQNTILYAECCCKRVGEIAFILRLGPLGDSIITEFQQLMKDPEAFVFRTNRAPSMFQCKRIEGDDPNFCMVGSLYESTTLEDPTIVENAQKKIEVCTELQSCGGPKKGGSGGKKGDDSVCEHSEPSPSEEPKKPKYPISKIRMGDITGPCGNTNCVLAHKVKNYIRALEAYKQKAAGIKETTDDSTKKVCGACSCKDDRHHRDDCPDNKGKMTCSGCGGLTQAGASCEDKKNAMLGTGATPKATPPHSKAQVMYVYSVTKMPDFKESMYGREFLLQNLEKDCEGKCNESVVTSTSKDAGCCQLTSLYKNNSQNVTNPDNKSSTRSLGINNPIVYNTNVTKKFSIYNCSEIPENKECQCNPPKPTPPCRTFDCECITENINIAARKAHKPFCPSYKHKSNCPVLKLEDEEKEDEEDEVEPLPYGLPPIQLGPCPIIGKPCTYPDGFARMYKTAAQPPQPPSHSEGGKVCCSKEYERIKKAIKEYMDYHKDDDFRCLNKFNVDTERRCCDKEQTLLALMGKACCGSHKLAIQDQYKEEQEEKKNRDKKK